MTKSKKKLASSEVPDDSEIPLKRQKSIQKDVKEKKKRKQSDSKSLDESQISDKKQKTEDLSHTEHENEEENPNNQDELEENTEAVSEEKKDKKFSKADKFQLTGKSLRSSFQSGHGFEILRRFVTVCNENKNSNLAAEYLEEGGSVLEVIKTFDTVDKNNINNITTLFSAVNILIMKILGLYPEDSEQYSKGGESCRRIINTYTSSIQTMLSNQSNAKQRKIVLKMLTTMITIGGNIPREILTNISLNSQILEAVVRLTKPNDPNNVRTSFIHFIIAFLVDGRGSIIRALLEKRDILTSVFPDLIYDTHETVHLILTSIKKYVLENSAISKTTKLHIFSTPVVQNLVNLYNWKGPSNWPGLKKEKDKTKEEKVDPEEKEIAVEAVHEFLLVLLTSKKHGIIFQDKSLGTGEGRKNNQLVNTILKSLDRPWEYEKPRDLVVQILRACPDLIKSQISLTESLLTPKPSMKWIKLMKFLNQIISHLDIERCFQDAKDLSELKIEQFANTVINLTLPNVVLKKAVAPALLQSNVIVRHESILLYTTMLSQTQQFLSLAKVFFDSAKFTALNNYLIEYMSDNAPAFERCLKTWTKALDSSESETIEEEIEIPSKKDILVSILSLLKVYNEVFPALVYINVDADVNFTTLLSGLSNPLEIEENLQSDLNILSIDLLLSVNPFMFTPSQEVYGQALLFLLMALDEESPLFNQTKSSIIKLLEVPRAFYECEDQIEIWFNAFLGLKDFDQRLEVSQWFVKIVGRIFKNVEKYNSAVKQAEKCCGIEMEKYMSYFEELTRNGAYYQKTNDRMQYITSLPLILCSALDSLKKKSTDVLIRFTNEILNHTLYYQVKPEPLIYLTKDIKELTLEDYF